jgi:hypothetical protein
MTGPNALTPARALMRTVAIPVPPVGNAALRNYPYSRSVPGFPPSVRGYSLHRRYKATLRVFQGNAWEPVAGFGTPAAGSCGPARWFMRWRSANPDVAIRAGVIIAPDQIIKTVPGGGAGYVAGDACYAPVFKFGSALRGNQSNLADVYLEWQLWTAKRRI